MARPASGCAPSSDPGTIRRDGLKTEAALYDPYSLYCLERGLAEVQQMDFAFWRKGEVRLSPSPMGEHFSGSCTVTSRNSLIHNGTTNGTKSERFESKGEQQGLLLRACRCVEEPFATVNFREFHFPRTRVNRTYNSARALHGLHPSRHYPTKQ